MTDQRRREELFARLDERARKDCFLIGCTLVLTGLVTMLAQLFC